MKKLIPMFLIVNLTVFTAHAQVLLSKGTNYTQNFDALAGAEAEIGASVPWTNNVTLPGWYARSQASGDYSNYRVSSGENKNSAFYSFGTNGANAVADRALGCIASSTPKVIAFGVRFKNDTDKAMTNIVVSYAGEQWRNSTDNGLEQTLRFSYRSGSAEITDPLPGETADWTAVDKLAFVRIHYGGEAEALDGNKKGNRKLFTNVELPGVSLKPGEELFLRWQDVDDEGQSDHALAIDDLSVSFTPVAGAD